MTVLICLLVVICLYIIFIAAPAVVMYKMVFCRKKGIPFTSRDLKDTYLAPYHNKIVADFHYFKSQENEFVSISADDGVELTGYYYGKSHKKLAICFHGYNSTPLNCFSSMGKLLMEQGYDVLLVNQRGHDRSGGVSTLGVLEQYDVVSWCKWAYDKNTSVKILLAGVSMGCASVAYSSDKLDGYNVCGLILDCGYISPYSQLSNDSKKRHLPSKLIMPIISFLTHSFLHIDIKIPVWKSLENSKLPVMFIHGEKDETVSINDTLINYGHCNTVKKLFIEKKANHANAFLAGDINAENAVKEFLNFLGKEDD